MTVFHSVAVTRTGRSDRGWSAPIVSRTIQALIVGLPARLLGLAVGAALSAAAPVAGASGVEGPRARPLPSLDQVVARARARSVETEQAEGNVRVAEGRRVGARQAVFGNPYFEVSAGRALKSASRAPVLDAQVWLPVEVSGARSARIREADALVDVKRAEALATEAVVVGTAIAEYGAFAVASERVRLLEALIEDSALESRYFLERFQSGDATRRDARLAEAELSRYRVSLEEARAERARASGALAVLTGVSYEPPGGERALEPPWVLLLRRADVSPAQRVLAAERQLFSLGVERSEREAVGAPSLIVNTGRGELGDAKAGLGLGYAIPVFRRNQGERAQLAAEIRRVNRVAERLKEAEAARVAALRVEVQALRSALGTLERETEPATRDTVEAAREMRVSGKVDLYAVLLARRDLSLIRLRRLELTRDAFLKLGELSATTGVRP